MSKVPGDLSYERIIAALRRDGWMVVRQNGSHIHLRKSIDGRQVRTMVPAHRPVLKSTLAKILKKAAIDIDRFLDLL
jgi:predicted RNA binding protein YcfA (HicA-like mRNA interferase family)